MLLIKFCGAFADVVKAQRLCHFKAILPVCIFIGGVYFFPVELLHFLLPSHLRHSSGMFPEFRNKLQLHAGIYYRRICTVLQCCCCLAQCPIFSPHKGQYTGFFMSDALAFFSLHCTRYSPEQSSTTVCFLGGPFTIRSMLLVLIPPFDFIFFYLYAAY